MRGSSWSRSMRPRHDDRQAVPQIPGDDAGPRWLPGRAAERSTTPSHPSERYHPTAGETACHAGRPYVEQCCKRAADTALTRGNEGCPPRASRAHRCDAPDSLFSKPRARHLACEIASKCSDAHRAAPRFLRSVGLRRRGDPDYRRTSRLGSGRASRIKPAARSASATKPARSSVGVLAGERSRPFDQPIDVAARAGVRRPASAAGRARRRPTRSRGSGRSGRGAPHV